MNALHLRPFFLLITRASVFWIGAFGLAAASVFVLGISEPEARLRLHLDPAFIAAFGFPLLAGWLAGAAIQEFQHTSFAAVLPGVRARMAAGFLTAGLVVTALVTAVVGSMDGAPHGLLVLVIGLAAYCAGGVFVDPLSTGVTAVNVVVAMLLVVRSQDVARLTASHPWATVAVCIMVGIAGLWRSFARSTFRKKPWRVTQPLPGRYSLERSREVERRRLIANGARRKGWRRGYLGTGAWPWVRAAIHETHGARAPRAVLRQINKGWGIALVFAGYAWVDKGELSFGKALALSMHDALFRSPHVPQFGDRGGPFLLVTIIIALLAVIGGLFAPTVLHGGLGHPLSRRQQARVAFRAGLVDVAFLVLGVGGILFVAGHLSGWLAGHELRFDFMPYYLRALLIAVILQPLARRGWLGLQAANRRKAANSLVAVIFGVTGFVVVVCFGTFVLPRVIVEPMAELALLLVGLVLSQLAYRKLLVEYYRTADLPGG